jgi:hypothetical protein
MSMQKPNFYQKNFRNSHFSTSMTQKIGQIMLSLSNKNRTNPLKNHNTPLLPANQHKFNKQPLKVIKI